MGNAQLATGWRPERPPGPCLAQPCAAVRGVVMATGIRDDQLTWAKVPSGRTPARRGPPSSRRAGRVGTASARRPNARLAGTWRFARQRVAENVYSAPAAEPQAYVDKPCPPRRQLIAPGPLTK